MDPILRARDRSEFESYPWPRDPSLHIPLQIRPPCVPLPPLPATVAAKSVNASGNTRRFPPSTQTSNIVAGGCPNDAGGKVQPVKMVHRVIAPTQNLTATRRAARLKRERKAARRLNADKLGEKLRSRADHLRNEAEYLAEQAWYSTSSEEEDV